MCPRLCKISILLLLIALPHPQHVHLQQLPSTCKQGQPQSQQEDSIIHVLKCLQALKLRFSQAISDVVCLSFDASFNTFRMGLFIAKGSRPRSAGPCLGVWLGTWNWGGLLLKQLLGEELCQTVFASKCLGWIAC